jgi:cellulose synthase/poly-beta-1,6-N-acetylglucosamine synthase-like glycosyltransferase
MDDSFVWISNLITLAQRRRWLNGSFLPRTRIDSHYIFRSFSLILRNVSIPILYNLLQLLFNVRISFTLTIKYIGLSSLYLPFFLLPNERKCWLRADPFFGAGTVVEILRHRPDCNHIDLYLLVGNSQGSNGSMHLRLSLWLSCNSLPTNYRLTIIPPVWLRKEHSKRTRQRPSWFILCRCTERIWRTCI